MQVNSGNAISNKMIYQKKKKDLHAVLIMLIYSQLTPLCTHKLGKNNELAHKKHKFDVFEMLVIL